MAKSGPLEKKVTLRLDDGLWEILKYMSGKDQKLNQSQMVREALQLWINLRINREFYPDSDLCIISLNMLRLALESMNEVELGRMSKIAFKNSKLSFDGFKKKFGDMDVFQSQMQGMENLKDRLAGLVASVYGPTGYRWFDEIDYSIINDTVVIKGKHRLGNHFTRFFRYHITNNLDEFDYEAESMHVNYVERKDDIREDHIELRLVKK
jgi:hypothetical protein